MKIIYSDRFLEHETGAFHAESPARLRAIVDSLRNSPLNSLLQWQEPTQSSERSHLYELIAEVHDVNYLQTVRMMAESGGGALDADTRVSPKSYEVAVLAVSAWLDAVDAILREGIPAFAIARPPGHHALKNRGMGFCIFNNAVISAKYALSHYSLAKVAILDWDVHHGNGTQELVWHDRRIGYVSIHQAPFYPGTGWSEEMGATENILNLPLKGGSGREEYVAVIDQKAIPFLREFAPELLIVSAGFDANSNDPLASMELLPQDFGLFAHKCKQFFPRVMFGLEGGYALDSLAESVLEVVKVYANHHH